MKTCKKCNQEKEFDQFSPSPARKDGLYSYCKSCAVEYQGEHKKIWRAKRVAKLTELKQRPCIDCGGKFPDVAMDFDHVRGEKLFNIGQAVHHDMAWQRLLDEVAKCDIVCANCHRIRSWCHNG